MRSQGWISAALVVAAVANARAEHAPVLSVDTVDRAACFDAAMLAARVRDEVGALDVRVGPTRGAATRVAVRTDGATLKVIITRRGSASAVSERRTLPAGGDCKSVLDAVALIVARAIVPLGWHPAPPKNRPSPTVANFDRRPLRSQPHADPGIDRRHHSPVDRPSAPLPPPTGKSDPFVAPQSPPSKPPTSPSSPLPTISASLPSPPPSLPPSPSRSPPPRLPAAPPPPISAAPPTAAPTAPPSNLPAPPPPPQSPQPPQPPRTPGTPGTIERTADRPARIQLGIAARYSFALAGGAAEPGGLLSLDARWGRLVITLAGGIDDQSQTTDAGSGATVAARRFPLFLEVSYEQPIPSGALRFSAGPMVELWSASSSHVARPDQALVAHPGLMTAVAYHLRLGRRVDLFAGADVEYALITESFAIDGLGQVATTPAFYLSLFTGASLNLL